MVSRKQFKSQFRKKKQVYDLLLKKIAVKTNVHFKKTHFEGTDITKFLATTQHLCIDIYP